MLCYNIVKEGDSLKTYKSIRGNGVYVVFSILLMCDLLTLAIINITNSYILTSLLKVFLVGCNIYQLYYLFLSVSLKYTLDNEKLNIIGLCGIKKISLPIKNILGYKIENGKIRGVKLSGFGRNSFALGKSVIHKIGTTSMYITNSKNIMYLNVDDSNYAISPENVLELEKELNSKGIKSLDWEQSSKVNGSLHKEKRFFIPFFIVSILVLVLTLNPFLLYLKNMLPARMPLNFDAAFKPMEFGTGKQFALSQMMYGVLNMAVLFCMYYAAYFYAKYDKKSAYRLIYIPLIVSAFFLFIQFKILITFK